MARVCSVNVRFEAKPYRTSLTTMVRAAHHTPSGPSVRRGTSIRYPGLTVLLQRTHTLGDASVRGVLVSSDTTVRFTDVSHVGSLVTTTQPAPSSVKIARHPEIAPDQALAAEPSLTRRAL